MLSPPDDFLKIFVQKIHNMRYQQGHTNTAFVKLDTKKCEACWKCMNVCSNNVISRINLPWHKHAIFVNQSTCAGCIKCVKVCNAGAISKSS